MAKKKLHNIIGLSICSAFLVGIIVANYFCAKYNVVITTTFQGDGTDFSSDAAVETLANNDEVVQRLVEDGAVLLKNNNNTLPLKNQTKVNLFGWGSFDPLLSGQGSAKATINEEKKVNLRDGFIKEGFEVNQELLDAYKTHKSGWWEQWLTINEPEVSFYSKIGNGGKTLLENAKSFSDIAIVTITRNGGEGWDLPLKQTKYKLNEDTTRHYLELTKEEEDLINLVGDNFEKTIILLNTGNAFELNIADENKVDAVLSMGYPGQSGTRSIARIIKGEINPSGRLSTTYPCDLQLDPSFVNAFRSGNHIHYTEDIYIGYKWYETADKENFFSQKWNKSYDEVVNYSFGEGLSYTTFNQEIVDYRLSTASTSLERTTKVDVDIKVKNTGSVKGKDVIQLYYTAPYTKGGIEKSAVSLLTYAKTDLLEPNEEKTYTLSFTSYDMASYDAYDKNTNGFAGYELESGNYEIKLMKNSHSLVDGTNNKINVNCERTIIYNRDPVTGAMVSNRYGEFDQNGKYINDSGYANCAIDGSNAGEEIKYLTRNDFINTFPDVQTPNRDIESVVSYANSYVEYKAYEGMSKPTQGVVLDNPLLLVTNSDGSKASKDQLKNGSGDLVWNKELVSELGQDYNNEKWETLLNQLTEDELTTIVESSGYGTDELESVGKLYHNEYDGGSGFNIGVNSGFGDQKSKWTGFPAATLVAQTWSKTDGYMMGNAIGKEGVATNVQGIYAPGVNLHRSAFCGRNFEYYSEDGVLSGYMASSVITGAKEAGVYCYLKHFALSEIGPNARQLNIWLTEQNLRENYLKPFEIAVKNGANAIMTAFNRLGATWTGGNYQLLQIILRKEWKFKGVVITDWCQGDWDMPVNQGVHAGNDIWLNPADRANMGGLDETKDSTWVCARRSAKNLLYTICNTQYTAWNAGTVTDIQERASGFRWWILGLVGINLVIIGLEAYFIWALIRQLRKKELEKEVVSYDYSNEYSLANTKINEIQNSLNLYKQKLKNLKYRKTEDIKNEYTQLITDLDQFIKNDEEKEN